MISKEDFDRMVFELCKDLAPVVEKSVLKAERVALQDWHIDRVKPPLMTVNFRLTWCPVCLLTTVGGFTLMHCECKTQKVSVKLNVQQYNAIVEKLKETKYLTREDLAEVLI